MTARAIQGPEWRSEFADVTGPFSGRAKTFVPVPHGRIRMWQLPLTSTLTEQAAPPAWVFVSLRDWRLRPKMLPQPPPAQLCHRTPWVMAASRWRERRGCQQAEAASHRSDIALPGRSCAAAPRDPAVSQASSWPSSHVQRLRQSDMGLVLSHLETKACAGVKCSPGQFPSFGGAAAWERAGAGALGRWPVPGASTTSGPAALSHLPGGEWGASSCYFPTNGRLESWCGWGSAFRSPQNMLTIIIPISLSYYPCNLQSTFAKISALDGVRQGALSLFYSHENCGCLPGSSPATSIYLTVSGPG